MEFNKNIKAGIIGGSGFAGEELVRMLSGHISVDLVAVSSRELEGLSISDTYKGISFSKKLSFTLPEDNLFLTCDVVFLATPHGVGMSEVVRFLDNGAKVIDLSADFRIQDVSIWEEWYKIKHQSPELIKDAVYGLTELNKKKIISSNLVAVPGCYPTASILGLLPLLIESIEIESIIIDAKSGISGAGRNTVTSGMKEDMEDNFKAYALDGHRHSPEISQIIEEVYGSPIKLNFLPHLIPTMRGIYATIYIQTNGLPKEDLDSIYSEYYKDSENVMILSENEIPSLRAVKKTNKCQILSVKTNIPNQIVVLSCIDNLLKGAAGQAIECLNLMFGFDQASGLD